MGRKVELSKLELSHCLLFSPKKYLSPVSLHRTRFYLTVMKCGSSCTKAALCGSAMFPGCPRQLGLWWLPVWREARKPWAPSSDAPLLPSPSYRTLQSLSGFHASNEEDVLFDGSIKFLSVQGILTTAQFIVYEGLRSSWCEMTSNKTMSTRSVTPARGLNTCLRFCDNTLQ